MKRNLITTTVAAALIAAANPITTNAGELLSREATRDVVTGAIGKHYLLGHNKWYTFKWNSDGTIEAFDFNAKSDAKPMDMGEWRIKEVKPKKGESAESIARRNATLGFVYCHQFETLFNGHDLCWNVEQETFNKVKGDDKKLQPSQRYKMYREAGAETGEYVITRR